jgi:hypothetical protein
VRFELWRCDDVEHFGMIVPCKSGVVFTNQVGGVARFHPEVEGVYVPLPKEWKPSLNEDPLYGLYNVGREEVQAFIEASVFSACVEAMDVRAHEAWVPVRVVSDMMLYGGSSYREPLLTAVLGQVVILTYWNSD